MFNQIHVSGSPLYSIILKDTAGYDLPNENNSNNIAISLSLSIGHPKGSQDRNRCPWAHPTQRKSLDGTAITWRRQLSYWDIPKVAYICIHAMCIYIYVNRYRSTRLYPMFACNICYDWAMWTAINVWPWNAGSALFSRDRGLEPNPVHAIGMQRTWYWHDLPPMYYSHPPCPTPDG